MKAVVLWLTSSLLCGCASSPPVRFFVLDPVSPANEASKPAGPPLQIVSVHMPATLDRRQIVREEAPNRLTISDQSRWGAPLPDMTRRILSQDLSARLSPGRLVLPEEPPPAGTRAISVDILEFGLAPSGSVVLDGTWSVVPSGADAAAASYRFQLSQPVAGGDYAEQARVMSTLLGQLADSIAQTSLTPPR
jgi:uncharacterized protein